MMNCEECELLHDRISIKQVVPLCKKDYEAGGTTALLDAIGITLQKIRNAQEESPKEERPKQVLFVITTDGLENASVEYSYEKVKQLIKRQKELGWQFIFLGANIDAIGTASRMGIDRDYAVDYHADRVGTEVNFSAVSETVIQCRMEGKLIIAGRRKSKLIIVIESNSLFNF
ncbi:VWA domain-containing protein [Ureibacillus sp. GCM10028918]|uniref:VWA domain-containing protein n=1 Tax=Ureibacillus sp. GCM10028918 TaxID=3273429 RepID=UPI003623F830